MVPTTKVANIWQPLNKGLLKIYTSLYQFGFGPISYNVNKIKWLVFERDITFTILNFIHKN